MVAIALQQRNLEVDVAESFGEAMRLLDHNSEKYCCLLLDLVLPDGDGIEIARRIDAENLGIPVVVITGYPERQGEMTGNAVRLVIRKPVEPDELSDFVHKDCPRWPRHTA